LYGYETWPLTLWEEYCSKVFKNRVWRGILVLIREGIKWGWRILHVEEIHDLYFHYKLFGFSRRVRRVGKTASMVEEKKML
jgi:hypothetical protein